MKIIVVGNGKIGELLVQQLSREGHEVVVVDSNPARLEFMQEKLDVAVVPGNGASIEILREAGADSADLLIAVTNSDEVNLLTALVAEKLGCNYTVARVRSPEYDREMNLLKTSFGIRTLDVKNVMIIGGSAIARYLATDLLRSGLHVTILETDLKKCEVLEDLLPGAAIIHGDGSLQHVLAEEGIANMDAVVPLTGIDEENIMISLYAHSIGTKKTITKVNRTEYVNLFGQEHLGAVVSPKVLTANEITRYARAASQTREGSVETLHTLGGGSIESLGFTVPEDAPFVNKPIMELPLQPSILIASIVRNQRVIIPGGQDCLMHGDSIVVIARASQMVSNLTDIFRNRGGEA